MNFIRNLERRFGKYAIRDLPAVIIGLYVAGYILSVMSPRVLGYLTLDPYFILKGQVWRLVTWIIVPPGTLDIFTVIMLFFYFSIGRGLERKWGSFLFNLYFFMGMLFTVIGAFIVYAWYMASYGHGIQMGYAFSTYYINMSIFMAFALSYPDATVLLYFIIPVKMKWMGILYGVLIVYSFIQSSLPGRVLIIASLLNFMIFWLLTSNGNRGRAYGGSGSFRNGRGAGGIFGQSRPDGARKIYPGTRGNAGKTGPAAGPSGVPLHRCAVCGRTEKDSDQLEFRYCSKCAGAFEYCQDHLFTHTHVKGP